ncbi:peptide-methionine (S)-S-oxide reductase MsrA [Lacibacterium aquatile]|uniref:Peptide methionine sulfoxide reductase MsrA n=1 Tax=Lacibacterium aquatile TaxID=1168082 RepID=A0ABW5DLB6_9PROT
MKMPTLRPVLLIAAITCLTFVGLRGTSSAEEAYLIPAPVTDEANTATSATAVFAGGCFWGVQGVFQHVTGVTNAVSGYVGGEAETAVYEKVGRGWTGHAEAVKITYDPRQISYGALLQIYFSVAHDPTQKDRQGPDVGPQYRSAIFPTSPEQERIAAAYIAQLDQAKVFPKAIATRLEGDKPFYAAEDYHQDFLTLNPSYPYIVFNDLPKIAALKAIFPKEYRDEPVLVGAVR